MNQPATRRKFVGCLLTVQHCPSSSTDILYYFVYYMPCVCCIVSETVPPQLCNYSKTYFISKELSEILQNSSNKEYIEDKGEKDSEESNVQIQEETDEAEASALQKEEQRKKQEVATASCTTNPTFPSKSGIQWQSKASLVTQRKACNIVSANPVFQNDGKNITSSSEVFQLFITNKMVEEICAESSKKRTRDFINMF